MGNKFILGQEDGTVAGGNTRGEGAVDLQMSRSSADRVASSNNSTIAGGANNRAAGVGVFIGGGSGNSAGGLDDYQVITGGLNNTISASGGAVIGGGLSNSIAGGGTGYQVIAGGRSNVGGSTYTVISGGQSNTASTGSHATVVGGQGNISSGQNSVSGGNQNIVSGYSSVAFGEANQATSGYAIAMGNSARATSSNTIALGLQNYATNFGAVAIGGSYTNAYIHYSIATGDSISTRGDAQFTSYISRVSSTLTSGGTVILTNSGGYVQGIPLGNNRMWNVQVRWVAVVTAITGTATGVTVGDTKSQNIEIGFKKVGGVSSLVGGGVFSTAQQDASMASASLVPTAGASQELALTFTAPTFSGGGSVTCRVVAKVELVEVAY